MWLRFAGVLTGEPSAGVRIRNFRQPGVDTRGLSSGRITRSRTAERVGSGMLQYGSTNRGDFGVAEGWNGLTGSAFRILGSASRVLSRAANETVWPSSPKRRRP